MNAAEFNLILEDRIRKIKAVLQSKADEYADDGERLHNFKRAATEFAVKNNETPAQALVGMMRKHWVSIADLVEKGSTDRGRIDEKLGDTINYLILLEAVLLERASNV